jgi:hypothetical protein
MSATSSISPKPTISNSLKGNKFGCLPTIATFLLLNRWVIVGESLGFRYGYWLYWKLVKAQYLHQR